MLGTQPRRRDYAPGNSLLEALGPVGTRLDRLEAKENPWPSGIPLRRNVDGLTWGLARILHGKELLPLLLVLLICQPRPHPRHLDQG
jgi:hypothetical protein